MWKQLGVVESPWYWVCFDVSTREEVMVEYTKAEHNLERKEKDVTSLINQFQSSSTHFITYISFLFFPLSILLFFIVSQSLYIHHGSVI